MDMKRGVIYKITSPNNKIYIGQSTNWQKRYSYYKNLKCKNQPKLYNTFLKYGLENFKFEILETNILQCFLNLYEQCYICLFDSYNSGLNCTEGGGFSPMSNPDIAAKVSKTKKGSIPWNKNLNKNDTRVAKNIIGGEKTRFKKGHKICLGRQYNQTTLNKMSDSAKKRCHKQDKFGRFTK